MQVVYASHSSAGVLQACAAIALLTLFLFFWYKAYLRMRVLWALLFAALALAGGIAWLWGTAGHVLDNAAWPLMNENAVVHNESRTVVFFVTFCMGVGLLTKVFRAWIMDLASAAEREPNGKGVRAWLSPMNVITGMLIVVGTYFSMGWRVWETALGVLGLLLAYPLLNCVLKGDSTMRDNAQAAAEERRRVLALVEAGKITADDGAELIGALGQSRVGEGMRVEERGVVTGNRRVMLLGAALVLVGFCLPWMAVNLGARVNEMVGGMQEQMRNFGVEMPGGVSGLPPGFQGNVECGAGADRGCGDRARGGCGAWAGVGDNGDGVGGGGVAAGMAGAGGESAGAARGFAGWAGGGDGVGDLYGGGDDWG